MRIVAFLLILSISVIAGNYVCYSKKISNGTRYKGCIKSSKSCKSLGKKRFGEYGSSSLQKKAYVQCKSLTKKKMDEIRCKKYGKCKKKKPKIIYKKCISCPDYVHPDSLKGGKCKKCRIKKSPIKPKIKYKKCKTCTDYVHPDSLKGGKCRKCRIKNSPIKPKIKYKKCKTCTDYVHPDSLKSGKCRKCRSKANNRSHTENDKLKQEIRELRERLKNAESKSNPAISQIEKLKTELNNLKADIKNLKAEIRLFNNKIEAKETELSTIEKREGYQIDTYLRNINSLNREEAKNGISKEREIKEYKDKIKEYKVFMARDRAKLQSKIENLRNELALKRKKLERYKLSRDEKFKLIKYYKSSK